MAETGTIAEAEAEIAEEFALFDEPREKYEYIIDLGKRLPPLPEEHRTPANKVSGCQSQVWLVAEPVPATGRLRLLADSDAVIVKGLIALLMRLYSDRPPAEILATPPRVFEAVGLGKLLTPGRSNGLYSMVKRIRELAAAAEAGRLVEAGA